MFTNGFTNMAAPRKVKNGWFIEICVNGHRKSKTLTTKKAVEMWAAKTKHELSELSEGVSHTHTMRNIFKRYQEEVSIGKKGERWEIIRLTKFCTYPLADIRLLEVKREDIQDWISERLTGAKPVKPSSVNRELNLMSHCLTEARRWRLMDKNPMQDLKRPKDPPHRDRRISDNEIETILVALNYSEHYPPEEKQQKIALAFLVAIETAMRAGEICALTIENLDLKKRVAFLPETKNGLPRSVPLTHEAVRLLKRLPGSPGEPIFGTTSPRLTALFKKGLARTDIKDLTFHDSRHEAITRLAKKLGVLDLARAVGHKNIKQLQTYYNATAEEIAELLD